jgi:hypothetical protein
MINALAIGQNFMRFVGTHFETFTAADTFVLKKHQLLFSLDGFRIMTPPTM